MNGMSLVISKPCCPMYNCCTSNKINLIPRRLSNLHLQGIFPPVSTTRMLKHRAYSLSAFKDVKGDRSEVPEVSGVELPHVLLGLGVIGFIGIALAKNWEAAAQSISTMGGIRGILEFSASFYILPSALVGLLAGPFLASIIHGLAVVLLHKPFSIGDIIEVGSVKGEVTQIGLLTTSLLRAENVPIRVLNSFFCRKAIVNKSRLVGWVAMVSKIFVQVDEIEKISEISEEIINMMKSNSNVYLKKEQPCCGISGFRRYGVELTLRCNLKAMSEDELLLVRQDILLQSAQIVEKHGATSGERMGENGGDDEQLPRSVPRRTDPNLPSNTIQRGDCGFKT